MKGRLILAAILCLAGTVGASALTLEEIQAAMNAANDRTRSALQDLPDFSGLTPGDRARSSPRVVGGDAALAPGQFEFTASLQIGNRHRCGGSFVAPHLQDGKVKDWLNNRTDGLWVVTAAHCTFALGGVPLLPGQLVVVGGQRHLEGDNPPAYRYAVERIIRHEEYGVVGRGLANDIALLRLGPRQDPVGGKADFQPRSIKLATHASVRNLFQPYARHTVNGWGHTSENGQISNFLQTAAIPFVPLDLCRAHYELIGSEVHGSSFCAGWATGGVDACQGDSGGPLFFDPTRSSGMVSSVPLLTGVVSWGEGCARAGFEGIYANIFQLRGWLEKAVLENL